MVALQVFSRLARVASLSGFVFVLTARSSTYLDIEGDGLSGEGLDEDLHIDISCCWGWGRGLSVGGERRDREEQAKRDGEVVRLRVSEGLSEK